MWVDGPAVPSPTMNPDDLDSAPCALCGRPCAEVNNGADWLNVEVTRSDGHGGFDYLYEDFCTQEHAAQWLARPLPAPVPADMSPHSSWKDRLISVFIVVALGWGAALMLLGSYALVRLLGGWDG